MAKAEGDKHHYIPKFYLKQWVDLKDPKGRLCEFSKPHKTVTPRRTNPDGTGYVRGLYTFNELPSDARDFIEKAFLLRADDDASIALRHLLNHNVDLDIALRSAWSRFIMSLLHRSPESVQRLRERIATGLPNALRELRESWEAARREDDPRKFEEYAISVPRRDLQQATVLLLQNVMDSKMVGSFLNNMVWGVLTFHRLRYPLLTSDRPYITTNGLDRGDGHIVLPISPNTIFIATRNAKTMSQIDQVCKREDMRMGEKINDTVVSQAVRYVYGTDDSQLRFVSNRFGQHRRSTPFG